MFVSRCWVLTVVRGMKTQDVSKKGLKYGDEDEDEAERKELNAHSIAFRPLIDWLRTELIGQISDGEYTRPLFGIELPI